VRNEALRLFLEGVSYSKIAKRLNTTRQTIGGWSQKGGWIIKRQKLDDGAEQRVYDFVKEMRERHIKITKAIQAKMIEELRKENAKITVNDGLKAMEHEAKLIMPENFSLQVNTQINNLDVTQILKIAQESDERRRKRRPETKVNRMV
jgi:IS30 family transposase